MSRIRTSRPTLVSYQAHTTGKSFFAPLGISIKGLTATKSASATHSWKFVRRGDLHLHALDGAASELEIPEAKPWCNMPLCQNMVRC